MLFRKKKTKGGLLALLDKMLFFSAVVPPGYIIYRFIRWYLRQDAVSATDFESYSDSDDSN